MSKRKYARDDYEAYFGMLGVLGTRWEIAVGHPGYRNSTGWHLLTKLWRQGPTKMADAYAFLTEIKSADKKRKLVEGAIKDELIECSDAMLVRKIRGKLQEGENPEPRRGKVSPDIWLSSEMNERIDIFLDEVIDELIKTAASIKARLRATRQPAAK